MLIWIDQTKFKKMAKRARKIVYMDKWTWPDVNQLHNIICPTCWNIKYGWLDTYNGLDSCLGGPIFKNVTRLAGKG